MGPVSVTVYKSGDVSVASSVQITTIMSCEFVYFLFYIVSTFLFLLFAAQANAATSKITI